MYKKIFIILPLLMLAFMLGSVQLSKAAETQSYQSNAVTGFYGEYVFEEENTGGSNHETNTGSNNGASNNGSNTGSNGHGGSSSISQLPITGDQQSALPLIGGLLILAVATMCVRRRQEYQND